MAPTEWEAIQAARQVAPATKWSDWKGLPGSTNLFRYFRQDADWKSASVTRSAKSKGDVTATLQAASKKHSATYEMPHLKHAPIGPTMATADVRPDGTVTVHTHNKNPQALRGQIALMLGIPTEQVIVRQYSGPGHGRSNGGNAGAEDEAVILSKELGRPVRVQWMRNEDFRILRSVSTRTAKSQPTKSITTCRPCRTTGRSAPYLRASPPCPLPAIKALASIQRSMATRTSGSTTAY